MSILGWIILGLICGFVADKLIDHPYEDAIINVALCIAGALVGTVGVLIGVRLLVTLGLSGVPDFGLYGMPVGIVGASLVLLLYHMVTHPRAWSAGAGADYRLTRVANDHAIFALFQSGSEEALKRRRSETRGTAAKGARAER